MSHTLRVYLAVVLGWAAITGAMLRITGIDLDSLTGAAVIAVLHMPSPMVAR